MFDWIANNKEWFLSGLGVFLLGLIGVFFKLFKKEEKDGGTKTQSIGNGAKSQGDMNFKNNKQEM